MTKKAVCCCDQIDPPILACCDPEMDGNCIETSLEDCLDIGWDPHAHGTRCADVDCTEPPPPDVTGACCHDGQCAYITRTQCLNDLGGQFMGEGVQCVDIDCDNFGCPEFHYLCDEVLSCNISFSGAKLCSTQNRTNGCWASATIPMTATGSGTNSPGWKTVFNQCIHHVSCGQCWLDCDSNCVAGGLVVNLIITCFGIGTSGYPRWRIGLGSVNVYGTIPAAPNLNCGGNELQPSCQPCWIHTFPNGEILNEGPCPAGIIELTLNGTTCTVTI
jgi:hypothetical protein